MTTSFTEMIKAVLKKIPRGRVATYGQIARLAGNPRAARQVVRVLNSSAEKDNLPWFRVINSRGGISLKRGQGYELQKALLENEGIVFGIGEIVDLKKFQWKPRVKKAGTRK